MRIVELDAERACDPVGDLEADSRQLGQPVRIGGEHGDDVLAVLTHEPGGEARADSVGEEKGLDLTDRRDLAPGVNSALDALTGDRPAGARAHFAEPVRVAVELLEDVLGPEVLDDRACERAPDPGDARHQPERDPVRGLRQRRPKRLDDELPAVLGVLRELACAEELVARTHMSERTCQAHGLAIARLAERGGPDGELRVWGHVPRAGDGQRDADLSGAWIGRRTARVDRPHATPILRKPEPLSLCRVRRSPSAVIEERGEG